GPDGTRTDGSQSNFGLKELSLMNDASKIAKDKLAAASRSKDTSRRLALSLAIASVGMLLILLVALLDYWFMLPMLLRVTAMTGLAALIVWGAAKLWTTW